MNIYFELNWDFLSKSFPFSPQFVQFPGNLLEMVRNILVNYRPIKLFPNEFKGSLSKMFECYVFTWEIDYIIVRFQTIIGQAP